MVNLTQELKNIHTGLDHLLFEYFLWKLSETL